MNSVSIVVLGFFASLQLAVALKGRATPEAEKSFASGPKLVPEASHKVGGVPDVVPDAERQASGIGQVVAEHTTLRGDHIDDFDQMWIASIRRRSDDVADGKVKRVHFESSYSSLNWFVFGGCVTLGVLTEVYGLKTSSKDLSLGESGGLLMMWIGVSAVFLGWIFMTLGAEGTVTWLDGYVLEMMLSVDNLFVFVLIMGAFSVPAVARGKLLMIGVVAALACRVIMFGTIAVFVHYAPFITKVLGAFICYCAYKMIMLDDDDEDVSDNAAVSFLSKFFPITNESNPEGLIFLNGKATPLFLAAGALIFLDLIFAVDSVSAKTALIEDVFLNYTSTGFAMFALRALYYLLEYASSMFEHLKYGISAILLLIGVKTMLPRSILAISDLQYLLLLVVILSGSMLFSVFSAHQNAILTEKEALKEAFEADLENREASSSSQ